MNARLPVALVLAAGLGSRLRPLTNDRPKCLVEVADRSLLSRCLVACRRAGLKEAVVVVGYHAAQVCAAVAQVPNMQVRCVHNADYERSGTAYSTGLGLSAIGNRDVVVIEGDVLFSPELLIALLSHSAENVALIDDFVGHTGSLVTLDGDRVTAWLHEHARAPDFDVFGTWKTVNLTRLAARSVRPGLHTAISAAMSTHGPTAPLEYALQFWIEHGAYIAGMSTAGLRWFEVDTIADLSTAVALFGEC